MKKTRKGFAGILLLAAVTLAAGGAFTPRAQAAQTAVEASTAVPAKRYTGVTKIKANLHKAMDLNSALVTSIPKNAVVVIDGRSSTWYKVTYKDYTGYLAASYLDENTDLVYSTTDVNLRSSRSTASAKNILLTIPEGAEMEVVERNTAWKNWIKINYKGKTGFASTLYVKTQEEIEEEEKKNALEELEKLKKEKANTIDLAEVEFENITVAYDGQSHKAPRVSNLPKGVEVKYTGATTYKKIGMFLIKATFTATEKGKKLVNATPRIAYIMITPEKNSVVTVKGIKYTITKANERGYGTATVKGPGKKTVKTVKIPEAVNIGGVRFTVTAVEKNAFKGCEKLTKVTVGAKVTELGASSFAQCPALTTVKLGRAVATLGAKVFYQDSKLKKITVLSEGLKTVGKNAFKKTAAGLVIQVPAGKADAYTALLKGKGLGKTAVIQ